MKIFLHTDSGLTLEDVHETATVADVAENAGIESATGSLEDGDDPLEGTALVANAVGDMGHLHLARCRRVEVTVRVHTSPARLP